MGFYFSDCGKEKMDAPVQADPLEILKHTLTQAFILTVLDDKGKVIDLNGNFVNTFNYTLPELYLQDYWMLHSGCHADQLWEEIWAVVQKGGQWTGELCHRTRKGGLIWLSSTIISFLGSGKISSRMLVIFTNISKQKETEKWQQLACHHEITNLPNRRMLGTVMESSIARAQRKRSQLAVLYMDINRFKTINDTYGHAVGDLVLQEVGNRLISVTPLHNFVFHVSGDEFVIIIEEIENLKTMIQAIMELFSKLFVINQFQIKVSASIGMSIYPDHSTDPKRLIEFADTAMYEVKGRTGTNFRKYSPSNYIPKPTLENE
ncbi:GGDEF domain-containing protein [Sporosarcina sp. ACRSM]|uniref:GGDEF domain-containing protein n=1 Tax=Sporosarcina sp. ACRSM TaxID=2918216 RepID=UPI001EF3E884|nr:GGDEF domain-containing protein [Sporosarcina sp. ACRSM]MCG7336602.1 GGDEF domain-containing protein [Sporosarcina sp. ACRSM]